MEKKTRFNAKTLALVGVLSALVFALSSVSIQIGDISRIHFGNIMCLLSGLLFGPFVGGIAAGFGSMLFDLSNPLYIAEFWITFLTKFAMGFAAGWLVRHMPEKMPTPARYGFSALGASTLYVALYLVKSAIIQYFVMGNAWDAVVPIVLTKAAISGLNALIAVAASMLLAPVLRTALNSAGLFRNSKAA